MIAYIVVGGLALTGITISAYNNAKKNKKLKEEERQRKLEYQFQLEKLKKDLYKPTQEVKQFNKDFEYFRNSEEYISNYDLFIFKSSYIKLYDLLKPINYNKLPNFRNEIQLIDRFLLEFSSIQDLINVRNSKFVNEELKKSNDLLSDIEGKSLDEQQRKAILVDEDNSLIIAGAGSGKTTTIAGKVKYLIQKLNIKPESILLISFTRKSADEMSERIQKKMDVSLSVKTFHKLGLDIIAESTNKKPSILGLSPKEILQLLNSFINNSKGNEQYFNNLIDFLAYYLKPYKDIHEFKSDSEHNNYLKEQKLEGYKIINKKTKDGVEISYRERFKSQEEVFISNFLFRNNIEYRYEESYKYKTASKKFGQYKPDFYLPEYDIYIEHFGINENNEVPNWFNGKDGLSANQVYNEGISWKRNEHKYNGTKLIETYSWEQNKGLLLINLKSKLEQAGVEFNPLSDDELWDYINENTPEDIDTFTQLLNTFLVLFKSNNESINNLSKKAKKESNQRAVLFLQLFEPILRNYENYLKEHNEIDFSDMINMATATIINNKYKSHYKYIIIDEFQDISQSRYQLVKALLDQKPETKLFCVGDDWQSIYRFAGSDIGLFTGFEKHFEQSTLDNYKRATNTSYIEYTYRFDNKLIELSSNFILKNPNQIEKSLKSHKKTDLAPYKIHRYNDSERNGKNTPKVLNEALSLISDKEKNNPTSILLLGRYDFERRVIEDSDFLVKKYNKSSNTYSYVYNDNIDHEINFLTVHTSKGLEADYVIILNGNSGTYGFPSEISDDPLLNFLLSKADQFPNGEERRLFYVAMTRAKKFVHVLSSYEYPSKFVSEIEINEPITSLKCEWCDNGKLIERNGSFGYFYACNNNHYCNYTKKINANDFFNLSKEYRKKGDRESEKMYLEKTLEIDDKHYQSYNNLGNYYSKLKNEHSKAIELFSKSLQFSTRPSITFYNRGLSFQQIGQFSEAIEDYSNYFKNKDKNQLFSNVHFEIALCYFKIDDYQKAIKHIEEQKKTSVNNNKLLAFEVVCKTKLKDAELEKFTKTETLIDTIDKNEIQESIQKAIEHDINLKFNYHKSVQFDGGIQSFRTIKPIEFKTIGNSLCISGYCYMRKEDRTFNIERISNLILNPSKIEYWSNN